MSPDFGLGLFYWSRFLGLAALLGLVIFRARRRWGNGEPDEGAKRILLPWLAVLLGFALYLGLLSLFLAPVVILYLVAMVAICVAVPALVSVVLLELGGRALGAERTGFWLGAGIVAFTAITFIWLGLIGIAPLLTAPALWPELLAMASIPASAAILWWSWLPGGGGGGGGIAETFE